MLEVLAYAAEEALSTGSGRAVVTLHVDGSVSVADNGRGTGTRVDDRGRAVRKPVMATKDLRFFDAPQPPPLPDGHPRRGMSVVAALSRWLVHTNRRGNGAWSQRYAHGIPVTDLVPVPGSGTSGTTVHFLPDPTLVPGSRIPARELHYLVAFGPHLTVEINDEHG
ncbi:ATP-binding protein [Actinosynnema sp. NPDC050801]|uniref:ATP-binding protein n=1 Tax=unclassified Actinosynnema TaxID=2637065 RepID=UPI0033D6C474